MVKKILSKIYLVFILLFLYAPILVLIVLSFNQSKSRVTWGGFTFKWYQELFKNSQIMEALQTTIVLALLAAALATILGLFACIGIDAMRKKGFAIMMGATMIPLLNADIVTGIALMLWIVRFMQLGFSSVLLSHITLCIPFVILCIMPKLRKIDVSIYEAARDLGAGPVYAFCKIILPEIYPGILAGFFMAITMSMDDFVITYFTKGSGINTLSTVIYGEIRKGIKPEMYALSTVIFVFILLLLLIGSIIKRKNEVVKN